MFDGVKIEQDDKHPIMFHDGTAYVSIRQLGEALGKQVHWDPEKSTVWVFDQVQQKTDVQIEEKKQWIEQTIQSLQDMQSYHASVQHNMKVESAGTNLGSGMQTAQEINMDVVLQPELTASGVKKSEMFSFVSDTKFYYTPNGFFVSEDGGHWDNQPQSQLDHVILKNLYAPYQVLQQFAKYSNDLKALKTDDQIKLSLSVQEDNFKNLALDYFPDGRPEDGTVKVTDFSMDFIFKAESGQPVQFVITVSAAEDDMNLNYQTIADYSQINGIKSIPVPDGVQS